MNQIGFVSRMVSEQNGTGRSKTTSSNQFAKQFLRVMSVSLMTVSTGESTTSCSLSASDLFPILLAAMCMTRLFGASQLLLLVLTCCFEVVTRQQAGEDKQALGLGYGVMLTVFYTVCCLDIGLYLHSASFTMPKNKHFTSLPRPFNVGTCSQQTSFFTQESHSP